MIGEYAASFLPASLVPAVGLLMPAIAMGLFFLYIESNATDA